MKINFYDSTQYWNDRYNANGNSGAGSYRHLAKFKANIVNGFIKKNKINSVIEFGCGDGNQLCFSNYKNYIGFDVAKQSINLCKKKFLHDNTKSFYTLQHYNGQIAEVSLSLDVIFHLIEDKIYYEYIQRLFNSSTKFVIIYSSNTDVNINNANHVKHRKFSDNVDYSNWALIQYVPNKYPYKEGDPQNTSFCDFYIFKKIK